MNTIELLWEDYRVACMDYTYEPTLRNYQISQAQFEAFMNIFEAKKDNGTH